MNELIEQVKEWHYERNLIEGSTNLAQYNKLCQEVKELSVSLDEGVSVIDDIGDIVVVLVGMAEREGLSLEQCLQHAYNDIKDRKGVVVDGIFVKEKKL